MERPEMRIGAPAEHHLQQVASVMRHEIHAGELRAQPTRQEVDCLLYTSDAADELDGVDLGGRRIIKKKKR